MTPKQKANELYPLDTIDFNRAYTELPSDILEERTNILMQRASFIAGANWQATHTKQLCVGFAEWILDNCEWGEEWYGKWYIYQGSNYSKSELYEHYLKYLKEKENGK